MISDGFRHSEATHGIRYLRLVGDGDSSVMATIRQTVPYGPFVEKIECANHACKSYRSRLEKLRMDHPEFCKRGALTKRSIQRLVVGARLAIKMHSETRNVQQLRHDLQNGPEHVFGIHRNCNPAFCTATSPTQPSPTNDNTRQQTTNTPSTAVPTPSCTSPPLSPTTSTPSALVPTSMLPASTDIGEITVDFGNFSQLLPSITLEDDSFTPAPEDVIDAQAVPSEESVLSLPSGIIEKVKGCGDRLVAMSTQLISNQTSNLAECYMGIRALYDGGKQFNRVQSGSFETRCYAAGLRMQEGPKWTAEVLQTTIGSSSGKVC